MTGKRSAPREPKFWYPADGGLPLAARALEPVSLLYRAAIHLKTRLAHPKQVDCPVICVGNVVAGGSGKTPVALSLAQHLVERGQQVAFLTRGYLGTLRGPVLVDPSRHTAAEVGDEALLLAQRAATVKSADRFAGARLARNEGADVIIMDDGLQNFGLRPLERTLRGSFEAIARVDRFGSHTGRTTSSRDGNGLWGSRVPRSGASTKP